MAPQSQFLACYRQAALSSTRVLQSSIRTPSLAPRAVSAISTRQFTAGSRDLKSYPEDLSTNSKTKTDKYPDDEHATSKVKKGDQLDIQSANAKEGIDSLKNNKGGAATERRDPAGGASKAKQEHPEAPDPAIGMQDERGGRGG